MGGCFQWRKPHKGGGVSTRGNPLQNARVVLWPSSELASDTFFIFGGRYLENLRLSIAAAEIKWIDQTVLTRHFRFRGGWSFPCQHYRPSDVSFASFDCSSPILLSKIIKGLGNCFHLRHPHSGQEKKKVLSLEFDPTTIYLT